MKLNKKFKQKWINALKSGKYKKGRYGLCSHSNEYCCLGVACAIATNTTAMPTAMLTPYSYPKQKHVKGTSYDITALQSLVRDLATMGILPNINDRNDTFEPAIKYIKENL